MDSYLVIRVNKKQYLLTEGEEFLLDKMLAEKPVAEVMLYKSGDQLFVGKPVTDKVKASLKVIEKEEKGDKVKVLKYKSKSRYRRRMGFRPVYTRVLLEKISLT